MHTVTNTDGALPTSDSTPSTGTRGAGGTADSSLHGQDSFRQTGLVSPQNDDSGAYDAHLAGSLSSQGPLFAMLQRENEPADPWGASAGNKHDSAVDPFSVRNSHTGAVNSTHGTYNQHRTYDEFSTYSAHGSRAIADNDRMSDDVLPPSPPRGAAPIEAPALSHSLHSYGSNSLYVSSTGRLGLHATYSRRVTDDGAERAVALHWGAFTGALQDHVGLIQRAHGVNLFIEEIGET